MSAEQYAGFGDDGQPWVQLNGGGAYTFSAVGKHDFEGFGIGGIAHSLAKINRYTGHTPQPYSAAQHSVFVSRLLDFDPILAMHGLAHDAHECIIGDISSPLKLAIRALCHGADPIASLEARADAVLWPVFGLGAPSDFQKEAIKRADLIALATEYRDLMDKRHDWRLPYPAHPKRIKAWTWFRAAEEFVSRFKGLEARLALGGTTT